MYDNDVYESIDILTDVLRYQIMLNKYFVSMFYATVISIIFVYIMMFVLMTHVESRYKKLKYKIKYTLNV